MNRTVRFITAFASISLCNLTMAQTTNIIDQTLAGRDGGSVGENESGGVAADLSGYTNVQITGSSLYGGNGGQAIGGTGVELFANGGAAVYLDGGKVVLDSSTLSGGNGANITVSTTGISAGGGHGLYIWGDVTLEGGEDGVDLSGGHGGLSVINSAAAGGARAFGGDAINYHGTEGASIAPQTIYFTGGNYVGGNGGGVTYNSDFVADPLSTDNYMGTYYDEITKFNGANGGHGVRIYNESYLKNGQVLEISQGTFEGGDGGTSDNGGVGDSVADGGSGIFTDFVDVNISGGTFRGGAAGVTNGVEASRGAALRMRDGDLTVTGGVFEGLGLWFEAHYYDATATISSGTFGDAIFTSTFDEFYNAERVNKANITGGTFGKVLFGGTSVNDADISDASFLAIEMGENAQNTLDMTSGSIGELTLSGVSAVNVATVSGTSVDWVRLSGGGENTATLTSAGVGLVEFSGMGANQLNLNSNGGLEQVNVYEGVGNIAFNTDHDINNIYISNGTLNVVGSDLTVSDGTYQLIEETAQLVVDNLTVDGGTLDSGRGTVTVGSDFVVKADSQLKSDVISDGAGGVTAGAITGADLVFEEGVSWGLTFGANVSTNENLLTNGIVLASATGTLSNEMDFADVSIVANNPNWLKGITDLTNVNETLIASYGDVAFTSVFENDDPEFQKAMTDLGMSVDNNPELREYLGAAWDDLESASATLEQGYTRTPEMASAMIGLQGVFADQIKDRTRSHLRFKKFGSTTSYSPSGSQGPSDWYDNTVQWANDHAPKWDFREAQRHASDNVAGDEYAALQDSLRSRTPGISSESIDVPETYQVWGRGYGSHVSQDATTGHVGYDASIGGGVLGVDKRFEKVLVGVGVGYAYTRVEGNAGNDGDADTLHAMAYFSRCSENLYFDASINYAFNDISTESVSALGYEADYNANTLGFAVGTGYGISFFKDKWLFTPEASYLGVLYDRGSYTEKSNEETSLPNKDYDSYNEWSHQTAVGVTLSMVGVIESFNTELEFQPELRVHWLHEFNTDLDDDSYVMAGGVGDSISVALQAREEDLIRLGAGIRFSEWGNETTEFGLDIDGAFADDYHNVVLSGKFMHRF
ncbi:MAG: autotransporter outer membrane beta-barrel domain-containing protein [Pontiella sp.]